MTLPAEAEAKLAVRERARRDKLYLATEVLGYDFQPDVHAELFAQYPDWDAEKSYFAASDDKNSLTLWPRGHYKTTGVVVEAIQEILNYPDIRILLMQGTLKTTKNLLREIKSHFTGQAASSRLVEFFPEFCAEKLGTNESFTVTARKRKQLQQATVTVASPKAIKTGQHYDVGFFDDLVNDQNYRNPELLQKVQEDFDMAFPLIDPGGYRRVTGTRYTFGDLYETLLRRDSEAKTNDGKWKISVKDCWLGGGQPRFPQRTLANGRLIGFTRELLLQIQRDDPVMFASQYLNRPIAVGQQLFPEEKMLAAVIAPQDAPALSQAILFVDLASSTRSVVADDSVILAGKTDSLGRVYVVDGIGGHWTPLEFALHIIEMALKHRPLRVMIEKTSAATYFMAYLMTVCKEKGVVLPLDYITVSTQKDAKRLRVEATEGPIATKRLFFFAGLPCWEKMFAQYTKFPKAPYGHDDYPDTVGLMLQELGKAMLFIPRPSGAHWLIQAIEQQGSALEGSMVKQEARETAGLGSDFIC